MTAPEQPRAISHAVLSGTVFLIATMLIVYWPGLNGPLVLDDLVNLDILRVLDEQNALYASQLIAERGGVLGGRPVSWLSFLWNWRACSGDVWCFKLVNVVMHLVNGVLALLLVRILLGETYRDVADRRRLDIIALFAVGMWILTPIQVSTVLYVVQRMALLAATFSLLGLLAYCAGRRLLGHSDLVAIPLMLFSILICWPLAALSKQTGVLLLPLLALTETLIFRRAREEPGWPMTLLAGCVLALISAGAVHLFLNPDWIAGTFAVRDFTMSDRLLTQPRVLTDYLLNVLQLPGGTPLGLLHDDFQISTGILAPPSTLPHLLGWTAAVAGAWLARNGPGRLISFGLFFFLIGHSIEAGPIGLEIYFEHRNYLPALGLMLGVGAFLVQVTLRFQRLQKVIIATSLLIMSATAASTMARVSTWSSWETIAASNAVNHPQSPRARVGAAAIAFTSGNLESGLAHLAAARLFGGDRMVAGLSFQEIAGYCLAGQTPPEAVYEGLASLPSLEDDPFTIASLRWYRKVATSESCAGLDASRVATLASRAISRTGGSGVLQARWVLYDELAHLLAAVGSLDEAARHLQVAYAGAPSSVRTEMARRLARLRRARP